MELEKRWCENCMNNTKHEILLYKCVDCGKKKRMPAFRGMAESTY